MRFIIFLVLLPCVSGAEIFGTAYHWESFEPVRNALITINTTPPQSYVARDGSYLFNVEAGFYKISARYYSEGVLKLEDDVLLEVPANGSYRVDLILTPALEEETLFDSIDVGIVESDVNPSRNNFIYALIGLILAMVILGFFWKLWSKRKQELREEAEDMEDIPEDLREVIDVIRREGGRIKQKDLRKIIGCSEAKLSLMLADLESRGIIRKIKKGRGNIIILK